jgi:hypothetical protein
VLGVAGTDTGVSLAGEGVALGALVLLVGVSVAVLVVGVLIVVAGAVSGNTTGLLRALLELVAGFAFTSKGVDVTGLVVGTGLAVVVGVVSILAELGVGGAEGVTTG